MFDGYEMLKNWQKFFFNELKHVYSKTELQSIFEIVIEDILGISFMQIQIHNTTLKFENKHYDRFLFILEALKKHKPIQYILGYTEFYGLQILVTPDTLIPRFETEELVEWVLSFAKKQPLKKIVDIGTGSGCIAIALKKKLNNSSICGVDLSKKALILAKENAITNNVNVSFFCQDILKQFTNMFLPQKIDCIVSNPPYVTTQEKKYMKQNVLNYEPECALFVSNDNPLIFYKRLCEIAVDNLDRNGALFVEINEHYANEILQLFNAYFEQVIIKKDMQQKNRMAMGWGLK